MKQEINLFQPIFRRQKKVFSAVTMLQVVALFVVVLTAIYAANLYHLRPFDADLARTNQDIARLKAELKTGTSIWPVAQTIELLALEVWMQTFFGTGRAGSRTIGLR